MCTITVNHPELIQKIVTQCNVTTDDNSNIRPELTTIVQADALWDTGATLSVITPDVVRQLKLKPLKYKLIDTANGQVNVPIYKVNLTMENGVQFNNVVVAATQLPSTQVLIGMDLITKGDLAVTNGNQKTTFSFQIPANRTIDFKEDKDMVNNAQLRKKFNVVSNTMTTVNGHNRKMILRKRLLYV
jgi:hypothetical protein